VEVIDIDRRDAQVRAAPVELIGQVARRHAVTARHDIRGREDARPDVGLDEVRVGIGGALAVEADEAAFGGQQHFLPRETARAAQPLQRRADAPLTALVAVVDGRIHHVEPEPERPGDRGGIGGVGRDVVIAEVGADADRGDLQAAPAVEVSVGGAGAEPRAVGGGAFGGRVSGDHPALP
jgi:hypothetical protein